MVKELTSDRDSYDFAGFRDAQKIQAAIHKSSSAERQGESWRVKSPELKKLTAVEVNLASIVEGKQSVKDNECSRTEAAFRQT